jgi:hypothetical protein
VRDYRMPRPDGIGVAKRVLEAKKWFDRWRVFEVDKDGRIQIVGDHINNRYTVSTPPDDSSPHDEEEPEPGS